MVGMRCLAFVSEKNEFEMSSGQLVDSVYLGYI